MHGEVVEAAERFWIVKLTGRRPALVRSLEEARRPIQNRIWRERRDQAVEDFVAELRAAADVEVNPAVLETVRVDVTPGAGAAAMPEGDNLTGSPELRVPANPRQVPNPAAMQPATIEPATMEPATMAPAAMQPATMTPATQPATMQPATMAPATTEPATMEAP